MRRAPASIGAAPSRAGSPGPSRRERGFTLIEAVTTIAIVSLGTIALASVVGVAAESQALSLDYGEVVDTGTITSNWLYTELREMRVPPSVGLQTMQASEVAFTDWSGRAIRYVRDGSKILRSENGGALQTFADGVTGFDLVYRRVNGTPAPFASQVARIDFAITLTRGDVTRRFGGQVWPRSTAPYIASWREE